MTSSTSIIRTLTGLTAGLVAGLIAAVPSASATEFPAYPVVSVSSHCDAVGGVLDLTFTNPGGLSAANFTVLVNGAAKPPVTVQPNDTDQEHYQTGLNLGVDLHISAAGMSDVVQAIAALPCFRGTGDAKLECSNDVPVLTTWFKNTGINTDSFVYDLAGDPSSPATFVLAAGAEQTVTRMLVDGAAVDMNVAMPSHMATVIGVHGNAPWCAASTTVPDTTSPPTTVPATTATTATTVPTVPTVTDPVPTTVAVPTVAPTTTEVASQSIVTVTPVLPVTGSSRTTTWAAIVVTTVGVIVCGSARRAARRS